MFFLFYVTDEHEDDTDGMSNPYKNYFYYIKCLPNF
jgi:hypothetical protein